MRVFYPFFLLLLSFEVYSQAHVDSILKNSWHAAIQPGLVFMGNQVKQEFSNPECGSRSNFTVTADYIYFSLRYSGADDSVAYQYFGDSLVLYPRNRNLYFDFIPCYDLANFTHDQLKPKWVFYNGRYIKQLPLAFEKLSISQWKGGSLEIDSSGQIFYEGHGGQQLYGHYRGSLSSKQLKEFRYILREESLGLMRTPCCSPLFYPNRGISNWYRFSAGAYTYSSEFTSEFMSSFGFSIFTFLNSTIQPTDLTFQHYAQGDSVEGVYVYPLAVENAHLLETRLAYLGTYEDNHQQYYLYTGKIDSVHYPIDTPFEASTKNAPLFLYAEHPIDTNKRMLIESTEVSPEWFVRGRAFKKPKGLIFRKVEKASEVPEGFKVIVQNPPRYINRFLHYNLPLSLNTNAFIENKPPNNYNTLWGIPYPFLRPDFQIAFESCVLPRWQNYLKQE